RTDAVDEATAGRGAPGGAVQQGRLHGRQAGHVARARGPQHVRVSAEGAGGRARRVQQHGVEGALVSPGRRVGGDDLAFQADASQILDHALEACGRAIHGHDLGAGGGQLQGLAARGGAEVDGGLTRLHVQQARGYGRGCVLHPPGSGLELGPAGDVAATTGAQGVARQHLGVQDLRQGRYVAARLEGKVGGRLLGHHGRHGPGVIRPPGAGPAGEQPRRHEGRRIVGRGSVAQQAAQHGVDQALERAAGLVGPGQLDAGGHGREGGHVEEEGLGRAQAQQIAHAWRRFLAELSGQGPVDRSQAAQGGHGEGAREGALTRLQGAESVGRRGLVEAAAARKGRVE
ncbi:conserved hypothetical protein, partial [Ricinus communis]